MTIISIQAKKLAEQFKAKVIQHGSLSFYPVAQGIVDIFSGIGWAQHSRYRNYKGKWYWIAGKKLDTSGFPNV